MTETQVRHVRDDDVDAIQRILEAAHVTRGTMRLPFHSRETIKERIRHVEGTTKLVCTHDEKIAGYAELVTNGEPRHRHAGEINMIATHPDFRGRKVGHKLMEHMIDLADNWLQLTRLGLTVWTSNASAIALYKEFGFAVDGAICLRGWPLCGCAHHGPRPRLKKERLPHLLQCWRRLCPQAVS